MSQSSFTEFREDIADDFLKTVSAFANDKGGVIIFGMDDRGQVKGLANAKQDFLDVENRIRASITPQPDYTLELQNRDRTIRLTVKGGNQKPYLYQSKAYIKNENRTTEADGLELTRLILEGKHLAFEDLPCKDQNLSFETLGGKLKEFIQIENLNQDILKILNLYSDRTGYNNAAGMLADENHFPGIDLIKFGESVNIIQQRVTLGHISVLSVYEKALEIFRTFYQYEVIKGSKREKIEQIPEAAFREAIVSALIHRAWDVESQIRALMFDDRIEIVSPGGLSGEISEDEFLSGKISIPRNRILAYVFERLGLVGTSNASVISLRELYEGSFSQPDYELSDHSIKIVLPVLETDLNLTEDERKVFELLSKTRLKPISEITPYVEFGKSKTTKLLKEMNRKGIVRIEGRGRGTRYVIR